MSATPVHSSRRARSFEIRHATAADVPALHQIIRSAFQQYEAVVGPALLAHYLADLLDVTGRVEDADVLVAERDGAPVGTVTFYRDGGELDIGWPAGWSAFRALGVESARRGRGAGRALVSACVERALAAGSETLALHTATFMRSAVALYERCGFVREPALDIVVTDVLDVVDVVDDGALPAVIAYRLARDAMDRAGG
jgi:predicted N-acetyltransferase YhbS